MTRYGQKMARRTDKLTGAILRRIEELRVQHGAPGAPMKQKTLARRAKQSYARVHRFLSGQMPYPPLDFLDALLRSLGTTLAETLTESSGSPPSPLPIVRADVQELAKLLDEVSADVVEQVKGLVVLFPRPPQADAASDRNGRARGSGKTRAAGAARSARALRRPD